MAQGSSHSLAGTCHCNVQQALGSAPPMHAVEQHRTSANQFSLPQLILQVSQHGLRPKVPEDCSPALAALMQRCWHEDPAQR